MRRPSNVVELRPQVGPSCPDPTCGALASMTKTTRDGAVVSSGPIVERSPDVVHAARLRLAALLAIGLGVALFVHALVDGGFEVSVPVQSVEEDDAPRGDR